MGRVVRDRTSQRPFVQIPGEGRQKLIRFSQCLSPPTPAETNSELQKSQGKLQQTQWSFGRDRSQFFSPPCFLP